MKLCRECGKKRRVPVGPRSTFYCDYHAGFHAGYQKSLMRDKRAADPVYRELERYAVRKRVRRLRATPGYVRPDRADAG